MTKRRRLLIIACVMSCLLIFLVGSFVAPPIARGVGWLQRNQPMPQTLAGAVALYRKFEEPYGIRARRFYEMTFFLDQLRGKLTQSQAQGYLGRPDYVKTFSPNTVVLVYKYDNSGKNDGAINVIFDKGILRYFTYFDANIESSEEWWDEAAKEEGLTRVPQTKPSTH